MLIFSKTIARMTLLEALRSRLVWVGLIAIGLAFGSAQFLTQVAMIEVAQIQVAIMAALLRATGVFIVAAFCITSLIREANDKITELLLSQPAARWEYYVGKLAGCAGVALVLAAGFSLPMMIYSSPAQVATWAASFTCELLIVAAISVFCAVSLTQATSAFAATAGFYLLGRSISTMQIIASAPIIPGDSWTNEAFRWIVDAIALVMPALDRMTLTDWVLDKPPSAADISGLFVQTLVYLILIGTATLVDLYRKSF